MRKGGGGRKGGRKEKKKKRKRECLNIGASYNSYHTVANKLLYIIIIAS